MKNSLILSSLVYGLATAGPLVQRQELNLDAYHAVATAATAVAAPVGDDAAETSATYNPTLVASAVAAQVTTADATATAAIVTGIAKAKRASDGTNSICTTRTFNGPQVSSPADTDQAFLDYSEFSENAINAALAENVPSGYAVSPDFVNLQASASNPSYLTYVSSSLTSYDASKCAALCDAMNGCVSFNIYYERDPLVISSVTQIPDSQYCPGESDSPSATLIKCAFYGMPLLASQATNKGQYQGDFHVVIAGSTAFFKSSAPSLSEYQGPVPFGNQSINCPAPVIDNGYLRVQTFDTTLPFDPSLCAASCAAQTAYNAKHGTFNGQACVFFNAYILYENGANGVFTCVYYGTPYDGSWASNDGQYDQQGNHYTIGNSFGYYLDGYYEQAVSGGPKPWST